MPVQGRRRRQPFARSLNPMTLARYNAAPDVAEKKQFETGIWAGAPSSQSIVCRSPPAPWLGRIQGPAARLTLVSLPTYPKQILERVPHFLLAAGARRTQPPGLVGISLALILSGRRPLAACRPWHGHFLVRLSVRRAAAWCRLFLLLLLVVVVRGQSGRRHQLSC